MSVDRRVLAADAFWRDEEDEARVHHLEAVVALAGRLKFRPKSIQTLPIERRAKHLAQMSSVSDGIATRALIAYHFAHARPLMSAFLDAVGLAHENGLITEEPKAPDPAALASAVDTVRRSFPNEEVDLYLRTLATLDGDTWAGVEALIAPNA
jgi:hypothetical protein